MLLAACTEGEGGIDGGAAAGAGKGCERPSNCRPLPLLAAAAVTAAGGGCVTSGRGSGEPVRGEGLSDEGAGALVATGTVSGGGMLATEGTAVLACRPLRLCGAGRRGGP